MRVIVLALCCGLVLPSPAAALTIVNDGPETVSVWIEKWLYRLRVGRSTSFNPSSEPVSITIESRHWRIVCEAAAGSDIRLTERECFVDGVSVGETRFHL